MEKKETVLVELNVKEVPDIIHKKFSSLEELKLNVKKACEKAEEAKKSADEAKKHSVGLFQKKGAIEALQTVTSDLAEAQILTVEAQKLSFEYHQKVTELTAYLFKLGVSSIAINRSVVRELELKLKGASQETLDEFARKEIMEVVRQLKEQEDLMNKHNELSNKVRFNREKTIEHDKLFEEKHRIDTLQSEEISRQVEKGKKLEKRIDARVEKDKSQDKEIARQAEMDEKLKKRIDARVEKDKNQDEEIARQMVKTQELEKQVNQLIDDNLEKDEYIKELQKNCTELSVRITENERLLNDTNANLLERLNEKADKKSLILPYLIAIVAILLSIIQYFIK